ncbi:MAG: PKD domain-containing protein [Bacteroidota bacterium]
MKHLYSLAAIGLFACNTLLFGQVSVSPQNSSGCAPHMVNFLCTAPGATYYIWYFDDGPQTGFTTNNVMPHTFGPRMVPYNGWVSAYDASYMFLGQAAFFINVNGAEDSLTTTNYNPCPGDMVVFDIGGTTNPSNIDWDFGDGSQLNNVPYYGVQHIYTSPGTYYPRAVVTTGCGTDTLWQVVNVSTSGVFPPFVNTYIPVDSLCPGDPFTVYPHYMYPNYVIDWGDGNFSTAQNAHVYNAPGSYLVKVTYINGCGNTLTQSGIATVANNLPISTVPFIDIYPDSACINSNVTFYPYPEAYASFSWNFGPNDNALTKVAIRQFTSTGDKPVTLTVTNGCGYSATAYDTVRIVSNIPIPPGGLNVFPPTICPGGAVMTEGNVSMGDDRDYLFSWDYGDGNTGTGRQTTHSYASAGSYTITLTISNACGNAQTYTAPVTVATNVQPDSAQFLFGPVPFQQASVPGCIGDSMVFIFAPVSSADSVIWDFGDMSSGIATQEITVEGGTYRIIKHMYTSNGTFYPRVTYKNTCGNSFTAYPPNSVTIGSNYSIEETNIFFDEAAYHCQGKDVTFYSYGGSYYIWNFGDGTGDFISYNTLVPMNHAFQNAGQYTVTCRVTNGCGYSVTDSVMITIPVSEININTNTVSASCGVNNGTAIAIGNGGATPYTYQWSNGNSTFMADSLASGIYVVTITDVHGCSNFAIATVSDQQAPAIAVSTVIDVSCYGGNNGAIDINPIGSSAPYTYLWSNGATTQDINQLVAGPYEVEVTDANGCKSTKSVMVGQPPEVVLSTLSGLATCGNSDGSAGVAVGGTTGPYNYIWSNGATTQTIYGLQAGIYTVTVVDNNGCIYSQNVAVNNQNAPIIVVDSITGTGCSNSLASVYVRTINGANPLSYSWSNGATTQDLLNVPVGMYTLKVTDANGCKSFRQVTIAKDEPAGTALCIVTVDTVTGFNKVVWNEDTSATDIAGFNIYKESTLSGLYYQVGYVDFDSASIWVDSLSDSRVRSWRYKVAVVDNCGNESAWSGEHKTIHLNVNVGINNSYNLIWDHYEGFSFSTYEIYRYSQANGWQYLGNVPSNIMSYTDLNPPVNTIAYMVDAVPSFTCNDNARYASGAGVLAAINTSHSNIKNLVATGPGGEEESIVATDFNLYPNPSSGSVGLSYPSSDDGYTITVYNAIGEIIFSSVIAPGDARMAINQKTIDLKGLAKGIYTIGISNKNGSVYKKLVLQ